MPKNRKNKIVRLAVIGVMSALSTLIYFVLPEIPLVPGVEYLKFDFSDIPALLTGFLLGAWQGAAVELLKNLLHLFRSTSVGIGEVMNTVLGAAMIFAMALFGKLLSKKCKKSRLSPAVYFVSAALTVAVTVAVGWALNLLLTPLYLKIMGLPVVKQTVFAGVTGSTLLNAVKAAFNLFPFYPVYFAVCRAFSKIDG